MKVKTSDLPGIGKRHSLITADGAQLVIITHHHGRRDIYHFKHPDDDEPNFSISFTDEEAHQIGAILIGVDYQPVADDKMELFMQNIRIEWLEISPQSCVAHKKIREAEIRSRTGCTVIGIKRGTEIIGSPDVDEVIRPGDVLMVIGKKGQLKTLEDLCQHRQTP